MRPLDTSRPAAATTTPTTDASESTRAGKTARRSPAPTVSALGNATSDVPLAPGSNARFAAEGKRQVEPGATVRSPATMTAPAKAAFVTLDAVSLVDMAKNSISGGSFKAVVPLRAGEAKFPSGKEEPAELLIREGGVCTLEAQLVSSDRGAQLADVAMKFDPPLRMQNPGIFIGGGVANALATVEISSIGFDKAGQMGVTGTVKVPFMGTKPLESFIKAGTLPVIDLHLEAFLKPGRAPTLPKVPTLDPKQLLATIGGIIDKATFDLVIDGPKQTMGVSSDGAEILSAEGRGSLKLNGALVSQNRTLTGNVTGSLNAGVSVGIELDTKDGAISADGITIMQKEGRLIAVAGDAEIQRVAGPIAVLIGDRTHLDAKVAGRLEHGIAITISEEGALSIALNQVVATLELTDATAAGSRFKVALGSPSTAGFKLAELSVGETGIVARGADGNFDLTVAEGSVDILGSTQTVKNGRVSVSANADSIDGNAGAKLAYDIPLVSQFPDGRRGESRAAGSFETKITR